MALAMVLSLLLWKSPTTVLRNGTLLFNGRDDSCFARRFHPGGFCRQGTPRCPPPPPGYAVGAGERLCVDFLGAGPISGGWEQDPFSAPPPGRSPDLFFRWLSLIFLAGFFWGHYTPTPVLFFSICGGGYVSPPLHFPHPFCWRSWGSPLVGFFSCQRNPCWALSIQKTAFPFFDMLFRPAVTRNSFFFTIVGAGVRHEDFFFHGGTPNKNQFPVLPGCEYLYFLFFSLQGAGANRRFRIPKAPQGTPPLPPLDQAKRQISDPGPNCFAGVFCFRRSFSGMLGFRRVFFFFFWFSILF